uniref:Uncharacterized protein n=1 Tax=Arundo donax TaxID=35708 RepID=A0A0A9EZP9_ARUDO
MFGDDFNNEPEFDRGPLADPFAFGNDGIVPPPSYSFGLLMVLGLAISLSKRT